MTQKPKAQFFSFMLNTRLGDEKPRLMYRAAPRYAETDEMVRAWDCAEEDPTSIPYGTAMSLAHGTGFAQVNEDELQDNCAATIAYEVQRLGIERGATLPPYCELAPLVADSAAFLKAYRLARRPSQDMKRMAQRFNEGAALYFRPGFSKEERHALRHAHERILDEILADQQSQKK